MPCGATKRPRARTCKAHACRRARRTAHIPLQVVRGPS
ncbi:hypothetical protein E1H18_1046 [Caulobacter sp. RHG1]|nr:hypothetical protein [Caulobacter sp. RHG1]